MRRLFLTMISLAFLVPASAIAEGSNELGPVQVLPTTELGVDILQASESLFFEGVGQLKITDSSGVSVAQLSAGQSHVFDAPGRYDLAFSDAQSGWQILVTGAAGPEPGRLFATRWDLEANRRQPILDTFFFVTVPGGSPSDTAVIEAEIVGIQGSKYSILANSSGVDGAWGRSVPTRNNTATGEYRIYLNPPLDATYTTLSPTLSGVAFDAGLGCTSLVPGSTSGVFEFETNVEGTYRIVCDRDADGDFDPTSNGDVVLHGATMAGVNQVSWDGTADGAALVAGTYECQLTVSSGETHLIVENAQTLFPGLRLFELDFALDGSGLLMFWNDSAVQSRAAVMANGDTSPESSGLAGVFSGLPSDAIMPHGETNTGNARAWGTPDLATGGTTKGLETFMDTWTELDTISGSIVTIDMVEASLDSDDDGLPDITESCVIGSNPEDADTDGDGVDDATEVERAGGTPEVPTDTDRDSIPDVLDDDDDGDGIPTAVEGGDDFDQDGLPNYLDLDSDGDGIEDAVECPEPEACRDTDGDEVPDYLQLDADGDGIEDAIEGHDLDHDGLPDVVATGRDSDDDGLDDAFDDECREGFECPDDGVAAPLPDRDEDGDPDYVDIDSDGDGIDDDVECGEGPSCSDSDGDGIPDYLDEDPVDSDDPDDPEDPDNPDEPIDEATSAEEFSAAGGGCSATSATPGAVPLVLALLLGLARRRV